ncbi:DUF2624 family protein [Salibacterium aidingense]|uniref:DUF2624 family protein n=1 Tax=Salibacterium aidingense TaxID=384933 RepID=UPI003BC8E0BC
MNHFKEQWVKYKISEMHPKDLIHYGNLFGITVTYEEAATVLNIVQNSSWSMDDQASLYAVLEKVEQNVSPETFRAIEQLFQQYFG